MDNLEILAGVGPAAAKALNAAGLNTFAAIAALTPDELKARIGAELRGRPDFAAMVSSAAAEHARTLVGNGGTGLTGSEGADVLHGSSTLDASYEIGGQTVQLGTIVAEAFEAFGGTTAEWNALGDAERDLLLQGQLDQLRVEATPAAGTSSPAAAGAALKDMPALAPATAEFSPRTLSPAELAAELRVQIDEVIDDYAADLQLQRNELLGLVDGFQLFEGHVVVAAPRPLSLPELMNQLSDVELEGGQARTIVTVIGPSRGLRRAGRLFNGTPQTVAVTPDELATIEGDPLLAVTRGAAVAHGEEQAQGRLPIEAFLGADGTPLPVKVLGPAKGRRRAGFAFGSEAQTVQLSREQLDLVLADEELSVTPMREAARV